MRTYYWHIAELAVPIGAWAVYDEGWIHMFTLEGFYSSKEVQLFLNDFCDIMVGQNE